MIARRSFLQSAAAMATVAAAGIPLPAIRPAAAAAPVATDQAPGFYRLAVGDMQVTALNDGVLSLSADILSAPTDIPKAELLEDAFLAADAIPTSVNGYLVNLGDRLALIDTGAAGGMGEGLGLLASNLAAAGIDPADVDDILMTHLHPDHANGLLTVEKEAAFPNAMVHVAEAEAGFWRDDGMMSRAPAEAQPFFIAARDAIAPYDQAGRLNIIASPGEILPGVSAVAAPGHTPGHTLFMLSSGSDQLLVWGDIVHVAAIQFPRPDATVAFDTDQAQAAQSRAKVFDQVATDRTLVAGMHLGFPGIGHVARASEGYAFVPVVWTPNL